MITHTGRLRVQAIGATVALLLLPTLSGCGPDGEGGAVVNDLNQQTCALTGTCNKCLKGEIGNLSVTAPATTENCKHISDWKALAAASCTKAGLTLTDYQVRSACKCETGSADHFSNVSYQCCPATPPPPPTCKPDDPATPLVNEDTCGKGASCIGGQCVPDAPAGCIKEDQGGPTSCKTTGTWKQYAADACKVKGLELTSYTPYEACGQDLWRHVSYVCCKPKPPGVCTPDDPATPLVNEDSCTNGATCVAGVCVPPPPLKVQITATTTQIGTRACVTESYYAYGACGSLASWNSYKAERIKLCTAQGWLVNSSGVGKACSGGYLDAYMQCCEPK